jgi:hypothetical protein
MINFPFPMAASPEVGEQSSADPTDLEVIYIIGDCPIRLRCRDIRPLRSDAKAVLVVLTVDEVCWASRIADVLDAWATARQSHDPYWITAVIERINRLARTSNGLVMFIPGVTNGEKLTGLA